MSASNPFDNEQLIAYINDADTRLIVSAAVSERWPTAMIHDGGLPAALSTLSQETSPPLVIVDVSGNEDPLSAVRSLLAVCEPTTRVFVLGSVNDVTLYRDMVKSGAADYLVKPVPPDAIADALIRAEKRADPGRGGHDANGPRIIAFIGARNGVGASTLAVNAAWILAHEQGRTVAVIDYDLQFGTVALSLDLEPSHGLREALENPDRIDGLFVASAMGHESERLYVLSAEEPLNEEIFIKNGAFELLVEALPVEFDFVIVDLPSSVAATQTSLLEMTNAVALVSDLSLAGMRDTVRMHQVVRDAAPNADIAVVINKVGAAKGELPKGEFQRGTELAIRHYVPSDFKLAATAANTGKPLAQVSRNAPIVKVFRDICETLSVDAPKGQPPGFFDKLLGKG